MIFTTLVAAVQHPGGFGDHGFGPGFGFLFLLIPLFWIGVVVLIVRLSTRRWRRARWAGTDYGAHPGWGGPRFGGGFGGPGWAQASPSAAAETTLAERFAQGDIDEQEYRARLEVLRANAYPPRQQPPASTPKAK